MENNTRIKRATTYLEGALYYLDGSPDNWSIKQARMYIKNAKSLLKGMNLPNIEKIIEELKKITKTK